MILAMGIPWPVSGQGSPVAINPELCLPAEHLRATPVTSPTIPQSTLSMERASLSLAARNLIACHNAGNWQIWSELLDPDYAEKLLGPGDAAARMEALDAAGFVLDTKLDWMGEPAVTGQTGTVAVRTFSGLFFRRETWLFERSADVWLLTDVIRELPVLETNAVGLTIRHSAAGLATSRDHLISPGAVLFRIENDTAGRLSTVILRLDSSQSIQGIAAVLEDDPRLRSAFLGWEQIEPIGSSLIAIVDPPAGTYVIVAGFDPFDPQPANLAAEDIVQVAVSL